MFDLNGKNVFLTGATGGLGKGMARSLCAAGARVVLAGRSAEALAALQAELGDRALYVAGDLADPSAPARLIQEAEEKLGAGVDVLINNAGLTRDGLSMRMKDEDWQQVLDVNLTGAFRLSRAVMKGMMSRRKGRIINITSIVGVVGNPGQANYAASKGGLIAMTKSMAMEVASRGITINCIAPGFVVTPMTDALNDDQRAKLLSSIPAGSLGQPEDIAAAAVFLASDEARYITGQTIHVNGGMAMI